MAIYNDLVSKKECLSLIGLGYVGLPIALAFAKKIKVIGFDINQARIEMMKRQVDPSQELSTSDFEGADITFTSNPEDLRKASFHIVAVPTPINKNNLPDLTPLLSATRTVGAVVKAGDYVVFESTVYPGATEEDCVPILEQLSELKSGKDFKVGYSPERINPGDKQHTLQTITKVVSGCDSESLEQIAKTYELVVEAGIFRASSIKVAEAAKIIENTQRDLNIALMNELSMIFQKMGINTYEVLQAAGTKWNFLKFYPGLVGGHCIGVDPYYLTYKAQELGHYARIINSGRAVNDGMGEYIAGNLVKRMIHNKINPCQCRVLIMGATFKEDVSDIRNSKVADVYQHLRHYGINSEVIDPHAITGEVMREYGFSLTPGAKGKYDAIILAVAHQEYINLDEQFFSEHLSPNGVFYDIKGIYVRKLTRLDYMSL